jgi:hypothetical protein
MPAARPRCVASGQHNGEDSRQQLGIFAGAIGRVLACAAISANIFWQTRL